MSLVSRSLTTKIDASDDFPLRKFFAIFRRFRRQAEARLRRALHLGKIPRLGPMVAVIGGRKSSLDDVSSDNGTAVGAHFRLFKILAM
ncbi:hypothetical protein PanWU01x14_241070 [Parasponia andersonii]|uniref:Uncharacterized protein n=1 Tax=Parasponia andersonii TaxID=3476 RepID=A0A2P5BGM3_PARAD|nr:hypothetical protein PanWU01x14_241070 [Parasponia andersonii]